MPAVLFDDNPVVMRRFLTLVSFVSFSLPLLGAVTVQSAPTIHVFSCQDISDDYFRVTQKDEIGLAVRFEVDSAQDLSSIVWRVPYESGYVDFTDDGNFSHGVRIDNFVLFEAGHLQANAGNILMDLISARNKIDANQPMATANMTLPAFISTEDPQNCTVVRTVGRDGSLWLNPGVSQSPPPLLFPTPAPYRKRGQPAPAPTPTPTPAAGMPILVYPCFVSVEGPSNWLNVHFADRSANAATDVIFRAPYGSGTLDFDDRGSFAPGIEIDHRVRGAPLDALRGRELNEPDTPRRCAVVRASFADGSVWQNPAMTGPAAPPTPIPDQLVLPAPAWIHWTSRHTFPTPIPSPVAAASP